MNDFIRSHVLALPPDAAIIQPDRMCQCHVKIALRHLGLVQHDAGNVAYGLVEALCLGVLLRRLSRGLLDSDPHGFTIGHT